MNIVDTELKRNHEDLGQTTDRIKRKFVKFAEECAGEGSGMPGYDETDSFGGLSTQLIQDLADSTPTGDSDDEEDDEVKADGDDEIVHSPANYTLKQFFEYPTDAAVSLENGLDFHWQYEAKDLQEELELYNILMEDD
jgi:hypothetical protein